MKTILKKVINKSNDLLFGYGKYNNLGNASINLIDVGSGGKLPPPWYKNTKYINSILSFEPQEEGLTSEYINNVGVALWSKKATKPFYIYEGRNHSGSSFYKPNVDYVDKNFAQLSRKGPRDLADSWHSRNKLIRTELLEVTSLDQILNTIDKSYNFIKIDAQGAELEILKGAENFLKKDCLGLQLELFSLPLYMNAPLIDDVVSYLKKLGFALVKKLPAHGTFLSQNDCIFLKDQVNNKDLKVLEDLKTIYRLVSFSTSNIQNSTN